MNRKPLLLLATASILFGCLPKEEPRPEPIVQDSTSSKDNPDGGSTASTDIPLTSENAYFYYPGEGFDLIRLEGGKVAPEVSSQEFAYQIKYIGMSTRIRSGGSYYEVEPIRRVFDLEQAENKDWKKEILQVYSTKIIRMTSYVYHSEDELHTDWSRIVSGEEGDLKAPWWTTRLRNEGTMIEAFRKSRKAGEGLGVIDNRMITKSVFLNSSAYAMNLILNNCLTESFERDRYTLPAEDLQEMYPPLVLLGYLKGRQVFNLYSFKPHLVSSSGEKPQYAFLQKDINDSWVTQMTRPGILGSFGLDHIWKILHTPALYIKELDNTLEKNKDEIIDIPQGGLIPITRFMIEENMRRRYRDTYAKLLDSRRLGKPRLRLGRVLQRRDERTSEPLYDVACILETRFGDNIILTPPSQRLTPELSKLYNTDEGFRARAEEVSQQVRQRFQGLELTGSREDIYDPERHDAVTIAFPFPMDSPDTYRYYEPKKKTWYIYNTKKGLAFAYYPITGEDVDPIDVQYGLSDWLSKIPERTISFVALASSYRIIGL